MSDCKTRVLQAVSAPAPLSNSVGTQAGHAQEVFQNLNLLLRMPYGADLVAHWNGEKTEKTTFLGVVQHLKSEYAQMVAMEYSSIESLNSLSILQEYRCKNVLEGKLKVPLFIENTLRSVTAALRSAQTTRTRFENSGKNFAAVLTVIESNITDIESKIAQMDKDIANANKELRNKIITLVADVIALSFAVGAALLSFGVFGPSAATGVALIALKVGSVAGATAAGIKTILDSMSLADVVAVISALESTQRALRSSLEQFKAVKPRFQTIVDGVVELEGFIRGMADQLQDLANDMDMTSQLALSEDDMKKVMKSWMSVRSQTQTWMDAINAQGIKPLLM